MIRSEEPRTRSLMRTSELAIGRLPAPQNRRDLARELRHEDALRRQKIESPHAATLKTWNRTRGTDSPITPPCPRAAGAQRAISRVLHYQVHVGTLDRKSVV